MTDTTSGLTRRDLFAASAGMIALGGGAMLPSEVQAAMGKGPTAHLLQTNGGYATVPLKKDTVVLSVVQTRVRAVDIGNLKATRKANLDHMIDTIDGAMGWGARGDILFFHEFPITGYSNRWGRKEAVQAAIEIPGEETEAIGRKAKEYGCYIVFGSYARDKAWPNHLLSITTIVGPNGQIVDKHWKARNIKGVFVGFELFTTTIHDVLDQYVEMYGRDAVMPVTRTDVGNIITSSVQREPEIFRAFALKGGEIFLRTATGGFTREDMMATSMYNQVYTAVCNNAVSTGNPGFLEAAGDVGGSTIWGPDGKVIDEAQSEHETNITARIPIAQFRARHRQPTIHTSLYEDIYAQYVERFPPNLFTPYQPTDGVDAARYLKDKSNWK
jgi:predicted amidohydrolase